jgi:hypothetical protein
VEWAALPPPYLLSFQVDLAIPQLIGNLHVDSLSKVYSLAPQRWDILAVIILLIYPSATLNNSMT